MRFGYGVTSKAAVIGTTWIKGGISWVNQTVALLQELRKIVPSNVEKFGIKVSQFSLPPPKQPGGAFPQNSKKTNFRYCALRLPQIGKVMPAALSPHEQ
ncbi:hypothetical protein TNCV_2968741 [Trichonephila clavipes]|nr:hypothetical protein TNCV_2968741 [Trichonephila clavipes]